MTFLDLFIFVPYVYCHKTLTSNKSDDEKNLFSFKVQMEVIFKLILFHLMDFVFYFFFYFINRTDYIS